MGRVAPIFDSQCILDVFAVRVATWMFS